MTSAADLGLAHRIGGGDVAAILGLAPRSWRKSTPWAVWAYLVGLLPDEPDNPVFRRGRNAELYIAREFTDQTGLVVAGEQMELTRPDVPWAVGRADGLVFDGPQDECSIDLALGGIEIKSSREWRAHDVLPVEWQAQANHYLWLSGLERWWFAVGYSGWHVAVYVHERDESVVQWQAEQVTRFYEDHVLPRIPPPVSADDLDAIGDVWPTAEPGTTVELHPDLAEQYDAAKETEIDAKRHYDAAKKATDDVKARILETAKEAEVLTVFGLPFATAKTTTVAEQVRAAYSFRSLRRITRKQAT